MSFAKNLLASSVTASVLAVSAFVPTVNAEVSASVGIASTYLWRGLDLGSGTPAVSGDLNYRNAGFYTGIWASSGDSAAGSEYDLYLGYGIAFGEDDMFSVDVSVWNYNYPTGAGYTDDNETDFSEWSDVVVSVGAGPVAFAVYSPVGRDNSSGDYMYYTLGGSFGQFSATLGLHADGAGAVGGCPEGETECDPMHLNLDYAYNDNLTFTLSQFVADETEGDDMKFVVSYSLPIGE